MLTLADTLKISSGANPEAVSDVLSSKLEIKRVAAPVKHLLEIRHCNDILLGLRMVKLNYRSQDAHLKR